MAKLTIRQIAQLAGVSPTAVSFVINGKSGISSETREKVCRILKETKYVPNPNSRRLLFGRSDNITVLLSRGDSRLGSQFYIELCNEIIPECSAAGYNLVYAYYSDENGELRFPPIINRRDTCGVIFLSSPREAVLRGIEDAELPYVISDAHFVRSGVMSVYTDYSAAAHGAVSYLIENGHRDIGSFDYNSGDYLEQTIRGLRAALAENGCEYRPEWQITTEDNDKLTHVACQSFLTGGRLPTAIFCSGDFIAISCLRFLRQNGIRVPEDISIIGIDNILMSGYVTPGLTTVSIDKHAMARESIRLLLDRVSGRNELPEHVEVPVGELIIRGSVCRYHG